MTGRGNVIEAMRRAKEEAARKAREEEEQRLQEEQAIRAVEEQATVRVGRGRGAINLDRLRSVSSQDNGTTSSISDSAFSEISTSLTQSSGSGRGKLINFMKKIK